MAELLTRQIVATTFAPGATHDFQMFKTSRLPLAATTECLADAGYQGLSTLHPLTPDPKAANRQVARQRIVAEHIIRRLKVFRILSERCRNRRRRFGLRFNLIAALYNLELTLVT
jgi:hypothetical protein